MNDINYKVYPLAIITEKFLARVASKLKILEERTSTKISYDFKENFFCIEGSSHENCIEVESLICEQLMPYLHDKMDSNFIEGVFSYPDMEQPVIQDTITTEQPSTVVGRAESSDSDSDAETRIDEEYINQEDYSELDQEDTNEPLVSKIFHISVTIKDIRSFVIGPAQKNMQPIDYLNEIPRMFDVECTLNGRDIFIVGVEVNVEEAYNVFSMIQRTVIGQSKTTLVPCIHYPRKSEEYGLYFCNVNDYKYKSMIHTKLEPGEAGNMHVILPVFIDQETNEYAKPKDLMQTEKKTTVIEPKPMEPIQQLEAVMERVAVKNEKQEQYWGDDREFTNLYNNGTLDYLPKDMLERAFTPVRQPSTSDSSIYSGEFPSLPQPNHVIAPRKEIKKKETRRRVMRIIPQKTIPTPVSTGTALLERVKEYNYQNIKKALVTGLESVRGFKGDIMLSAKLGKVLWPTTNKNVTQKIWELEDITDIVVRELGTIPRFTTMTTMDEHILDCITSDRVIPHHLYNKTAIFEFHCMARNQPALQYKPIVLHMNQGVVDVRKVVIREHSVTEVDWVNLDRKFDFQLSLNTKELIRTDVKPFTTFIKWVSICPITHFMTFQDVPNFLQVKKVIFKQTTRFRIAFPYIVEIVRVEDVPLQRVPGTDKINAAVGKGECWFDFQVYNILHETLFRQNVRLDVGQEAEWTVDDILNTASGDTITDYVKHMLTIIEKIEMVARSMSF